jgi:transposase
LTLPAAAQRIAFEEYVGAVEEASARVERYRRAIEQELAHWRWQPVVAALQACRGIQFIHAVRIVAELGDLTRFGHPRQLMAYLGLVPSEDSTGERRRQGSITKAGNSSARRALVEAAWAYQHRPAVSARHPIMWTPPPNAEGGVSWASPSDRRRSTATRMSSRFRRFGFR